MLLRDVEVALCWAFCRCSLSVIGQTPAPGPQRLCKTTAFELLVKVSVRLLACGPKLQVLASQSPCTPLSSAMGLCVTMWHAYKYVCPKHDGLNAVRRTKGLIRIDSGALPENLTEGSSTFPGGALHVRALHRSYTSTSNTAC